MIRICIILVIMSLQLSFLLPCNKWKLLMFVLFFQIYYGLIFRHTRLVNRVCKFAIPLLFIRSTKTEILIFYVGGVSSILIAFCPWTKTYIPLIFRSWVVYIRWATICKIAVLLQRRQHWDSLPTFHYNAFVIHLFWLRYSVQIILLFLRCFILTW